MTRKGTGTIAVITFGKIVKCYSRRINQRHVSMKRRQLNQNNELLDE